ncbi:hypothetical protein FTUN_0203 [Frigoriglobus tundricola]|uniref:Uncharacterized protein n=1 Tax=Frigoriglobus tundricola TaxID=2774151 RepID=A0A6M5YHG5_9BACT|nr:hypothetical protein FTUN_0203 [Frigoriglobus tundricola]
MLGVNGLGRGTGAAPRTRVPGRDRTKSISKWLQSGRAIKCSWRRLEYGPAGPIGFSAPAAGPFLAKVARSGRRT